MQINLLPCPFCDGQAEFHPQEHHMNNFWNKNTIYCPTCDFMMEGVSWLQLINKWNTRKSIEHLTERLEKRCSSFDCKVCRHYGDGTDTCSEDCTDALILDLFDLVEESGKIKNAD